MRLPAGRTRLAATVAAVATLVVAAVGVGALAGHLSRSSRDPAQPTVRPADRAASPAGPIGPDDLAAATTSPAAGGTSTPGASSSAAAKAVLARSGQGDVVGGVVDPADPGALDQRTLGPQGPTRSTPCRGSAQAHFPPPLEDRDSGDGRRWVAIGGVQGRCGGTSEVFEVGADTLRRDVRLRFRSDAEGLLVELVDQVEGREAAGGFRELACDAACAGTQVLIPRAGRYRLEVSASDGPWEVAVEEYR